MGRNPPVPVACFSRLEKIHFLNMTRVLRALRRAGTALVLASIVGCLYGQVLLYVPAETSNELWEYGVVSGTGNLTNFPTQGVTGNQPNVVAVTPNNRFMYVGNATGNIIAYLVNYDGTLSPVGPPFATAGGIRGLAIDSTGQYLYAANSTGNRIVMFRINQTSGALDFANPVNTDLGAGSGPRGLVADAAGHLYAALAGAGTVAAFRVESNGALTALGQVAAGNTPDRLALANGTYLYATNYYGQSISIFNVQGSGALALNATPTVATPDVRPYCVAVDNTGKYLIVTLNTITTANNVVVYQITNTGGLTLLSQNPSGGNLPSGVATDPSNRYLYVANSGSGTVTKFNLNSNGALTDAATFATGGTPQFLVSKPAPSAPGVPAASTWSLLGLGILLAGSSAFLYRRAYR
jgi:6-phosphogluconolactonase (cycloisomerase 2 family)